MVENFPLHRHRSVESREENFISFKLFRCLILFFFKFTLDVKLFIWMEYYIFYFLLFSRCNCKCAFFDSKLFFKKTKSNRFASFTGAYQWKEHCRSKKHRAVLYSKKVRELKKKFGVLKMPIVGNSTKKDEQ